MIFNRITGHFDLKVPSLEGFRWPELEEKVEDIRRIEGDFGEAGRTLRELTDNRPKAKRDDTAAYASAIKAGKKDPGAKHADALEEQIAAVTRRRDALRVVLKGRASELIDLVEHGREEWTNEALASLAAADAVVEEARAAVARSEAEVLRHRQLLAFLEDPENYRPSKVGKKAAKAPASPQPTFSVINATPQGGGAGVA